MSKIGNWVIAMQEDADDMTTAEFITKHGVAKNWLSITGERFVPEERNKGKIENEYVWRNRKH